MLALVSGGPDSTALAHWLALLSRQISFQWGIVHFDHGLRDDSHQQAQAVRRLAGSLGTFFYLRKLPVAGLVKKRKTSIEHAARLLRYREAARLARRLNINKVATAHTLEEQAESILINILRGGSAAGLLGARAARPIFYGSKIKLIRPMVHIRKKEVLEFLDAGGIPYFRDPMNSDPRFLRARVRAELLPKLTELHPKALQHITGLAEKFGVK